MPVFCLLIASCCPGLSPVIPSQVEEVRPGVLSGYLAIQEVPDSKALLPPPPALASAAFAADQEAFSRTRTLKGSKRWDLAIRDANLDMPEVFDAFSCALGFSIRREDMPHLYMLLQRSFTDAAYTTFAAKNHYRRQRPFQVNRQDSCTPDEQEHLSGSGSYPSGHTSIGWTWALILAEVVPDRADAILQRGHSFGQSRVVCGVHWQSDIHAGRVIGAAVVARLHADPIFRAQLDAARREISTVRARMPSSPASCLPEADFSQK